jgi:hypothetical protein
MSFGVTDKAPIPHVVISVLIKPQLPHEVVRIGFGRRLSGFIHIHIGIGRFTLSYSRPRTEAAHGRSSVLFPRTNRDPSWNGRDLNVEYASCRRNLDNKCNSKNLVYSRGFVCAPKTRKPKSFQPGRFDPLYKRVGHEDTIEMRYLENHSPG